jgi:hypothetical protein
VSNEACRQWERTLNNVKAQARGLPRRKQPMLPSVCQLHPHDHVSRLLSPDCARASWNTWVEANTTRRAASAESVAGHDRFLRLPLDEVA